MTRTAPLQLRCAACGAIQVVFIYLFYTQIIHKVDIEKNYLKTIFFELLNKITLIKERKGSGLV